ncbi:hypothetical protein EPH95_11465 [Salicibibacter halophilus]|uniref:Uncharacterized protein n=1 Tax=Salicibibacter halophilus TaxID=2502791 RepID=A0A514LIN8_9BACI|nr:hypothetical protein [Salicibibacter halophilus]QDI91714.1 hypothetical protein EPH95_11465 [Salicibibacter halophilus]
MRNAKKSLVVFLTLVLLCSLFFNYQYYQVNQDHQRHFAIFLNDFHIELNNAIERTDTIINEDYQEYNSELLRLTQSLTMISHMLTRNGDYMYDLPQINELDYIERSVNIMINGTEYQGYEIKPFLNSNGINDSEEQFLRGIKNKMEKIQGQLNSKETTQVDSTINKNMYENIITENALSEQEFYTMLDAYIKEK